MSTTMGGLSVGTRSASSIRTSTYTENQSYQHQSLQQSHQHQSLQQSHQLQSSHIHQCSGTYNAIIGQSVQQLLSQSTQVISYLNVNASQIYHQSQQDEHCELQSLNNRLASFATSIKVLQQQNQTLMAQVNQKSHSGLLVRLKKSSASLSWEFKRIEETLNLKKPCCIEIARLKDCLHYYRIRIENLKCAEEAICIYEDEHSCKTELVRIKNIHTTTCTHEHDIVSKVKSLWELWRSVHIELHNIRSRRIELQYKRRMLKDQVFFLRRSLSIDIIAYKTLSTCSSVAMTTHFDSVIRIIDAEYKRMIIEQKTDYDAFIAIQIQEYTSVITCKQKAYTEMEQKIITMKEKIEHMCGRITTITTQTDSCFIEFQHLSYEMSVDIDEFKSAKCVLQDTLCRYRNTYKTTLIEIVEILLDTKRTLDSELFIYLTLLGQLNITQTITVVPCLPGPKKDPVTNSFDWGNVKVEHSCPNGNWIRLENTSPDQPRDISHFMMESIVDGKSVAKYTFPAHTIIEPGKGLMVWAQRINYQAPVHKESDKHLVAGTSPWSSDRNYWKIQVKLFEPNGNLHASHERTHNESTVPSIHHHTP